MSIPVITFFNNKGGVGKTSLVYHLSWMMAELGRRVLACDLDPQANLTAAFLNEDLLEDVWGREQANNTVFRCVQPLLKVGDLGEPDLAPIGPNLSLLPGDIGLSGFEDALAGEWPNALGSTELYRPFRILTAFWTVMQAGARQVDADIILADVGPNLGAINRSALIATDHVIVPLAADMFSLQGLRNLGPALGKWRAEWTKRLENYKQPEFPLPKGRMEPAGYVVQQHSVRLSRPVKAFDKWLRRIPEAYATHLLGETDGPWPNDPEHDQRRLASLKHFRSLVPMAQEARKPIFHLTAADGAIGGHAGSVADARNDFHALARKIIERIGLTS